MSIFDVPCTDINDSKFSSHFECVVPSYQVDVGSNAKHEAFNAMKQLEGWCSVDKACVLMDLILWTKPQTVVEIGVFGGKSLIPMAYALKANGQGIVYGIDPWSSAESCIGMEGVNQEWWGKINHDVILKGLLNKIKKFNLEEQIRLIRMTSMDAPILEEIDVLHIDGNHSEETSYQDVTKWVPHVKKGGIIIFDDITWYTTGKAVQWLDGCCVKILELGGDNVWGVWIKT